MDTNTNDYKVEGIEGSQAETISMPRLVAWVKPTLERLSLKDALANQGTSGDGVLGASS